MQQEYWQRQTEKKPLFPDLLWSRPEHIRTAGKLGIVGGNVHGFAAAAEAYAAASKAGIGSSRVLLPDSLQKTVGRVFEAGEFAPSTPSGSFSQSAIADLTALYEWADSMLVAGDLGHNSETAILLENLVQTYGGQLTLCKDAVDYFTATPKSLLERPDTLLVLSFAQLQKLAINARFPMAFTFNMDLLRLIDHLHALTTKYKLYIIVKHLENTLVSVGPQVSTTKLSQDRSVWRVVTAAEASVWWLQNPSKPFQSITTALISQYIQIDP